MTEKYDDDIVIDLGDVQSSPFFANTLWTDFTSLSTFRTCNRKYHYRIHRGLVTEYAHSIPEFEFGKCIHLALGSLYRTHNVLDAIDVFADSYKLTPDDQKRSLSRGCELIAGYWNHWRPWIEEIEVVELEYRFDIPLEDYAENFMFRGIIDLIYRSQRTDIYGMIDFKTSSYLSSPIEEAFSISRQFLGYYYALQHDKKYRDKIDEMFVDILLVHAKNNDYQRVSISPENQNEWLRGTLHNLRQIDSCRNENEWPQSDVSACSAYNRVCPYLRLCSTREVDREELIKLNYLVEPWDLNERGIVPTEKGE